MHSVQSGNDIPEWFIQAVAQPGESRYVTVEKGAIHCLTWNLDDTSKPVLLLLHGFRAHAHWWDVIAPFLQDHYRVVAPDFSGMGDSAHREHYDLHTFDRDIAGVIQGLGLGEVMAVAHSFGGCRLLRACAEHPGMIRHAIIVDSYVNFPPADPDMQAPDAARGAQNYPDLGSAMARFRLTPPEPRAWPCLVHHIARHSLRQAAHGWRWKFDAGMAAGLLPEFDGSALLAGIRNPVDIVFGAESKVVDAERCARIEAHLPQPGQVVAIADAGHHVMLSQPMALVGALRGLLSEAGNGALVK